MTDGITEMYRGFEREKEVEEKVKEHMEEWEKKCEEATAAALALCPDNIRSWLIACTANEDGKAYSSSFHGYGDVQWFEVGRNASHYFSFGVRTDGVFIKKTNGDEYHEECKCWYNRTTLRVVTPEEVCQGYWGHM